MPMTSDQIEAQMKRQAARLAATAHVLAIIIAELAISQNSDEILSRVSASVDALLDPKNDGLGLVVSEDIRIEKDKIISLANLELRRRRK